MFARAGVVDDPGQADHQWLGQRERDRRGGPENAEDRLPAGRGVQAAGVVEQVTGDRPGIQRVQLDRRRPQGRPRSLRSHQLPVLFRPAGHHDLLTGQQRIADPGKGRTADVVGHLVQAIQDRQHQARGQEPINAAPFRTAEPLGGQSGMIGGQLETKPAVQVLDTGIPGGEGGQRRDRGTGPRRASRSRTSRTISIVLPAPGSPSTTSRPVGTRASTSPRSPRLRPGRPDRRPRFPAVLATIRLPWSPAAPASPSHRRGMQPLVPRRPAAGTGRSDGEPWPLPPIERRSRRQAGRRGPAGPGPWLGPHPARYGDSRWRGQLRSLRGGIGIIGAAHPGQRLGLLHRDTYRPVRCGITGRNMPDHVVEEPRRGDHRERTARTGQRLLQRLSFQEPEGGVDRGTGHAVGITVDLAGVQHQPYPDCPFPPALLVVQAQRSAKLPRKPGGQELLRYLRRDQEHRPVTTILVITDVPRDPRPGECLTQARVQSVPNRELIRIRPPGSVSLDVHPQDRPMQSRKRFTIPAAFLPRAPTSMIVWRIESTHERQDRPPVSGCSPHSGQTFGLDP